MGSVNQPAVSAKVRAIGRETSVVNLGISVWLAKLASTGEVVTFNLLSNPDGRGPGSRR